MADHERYTKPVDCCTCVPCEKKRLDAMDRAVVDWMVASADLAEHLPSVMTAHMSPHISNVVTILKDNIDTELWERMMKVARAETLADQETWTKEGRIA